MNDIGYPIGLFHYFDENRFQLFDDFFLYLEHPLGLHAAELLLVMLDLR
jgi:hypothetical protein